MNRDAELTNLLNSASEGRETTKAQDRKAVDKSKWLSNVITLKLKDSEGNVRPGCEFKIQRRKLTAKTIQDMVNKCPLKVEIDYVYNSTGLAIFLDDFLTLAQPEPEYYFIVPKVRRTPFDIRRDKRYEGQRCFTISRVPLKSKDEKTEVDSATLKEWLVFALLEVDPYSKPFYKNISNIKDEIAAIDKKIKGIPKMDFQAADGTAMSQVEADVERETLYNAYSEERITCEKRLKRQEAALEGHRAWRRNMGIQFTKGEVDKNTETTTWFVRFYGTKDAEEMENLLMDKDDWASIKLAQQSISPPLPAWAGRGDIPDGSKSFLPDYSQLQVNISGAVIKRVPHGVGSWKTLDRKSSRYSDDEFSFYYGQWYEGYKHGYGVEIDDSGIYSGQFIDGFRSGQGRVDYANGTTVTSEFSVLLQHPDRHKGIFRNPYLNGEPNGYSEILFADGGLYKGILINGEVTGIGEYESAFNEKFRGTFNNGCLNGSNGFYKNYADEKYFGHWRQGELDGRGSYTNERGDSYIGYWKGFLKHGRGRDYYKNIGEYRGYFINGTRSGKGELDFINRKAPKKKRRAGTEPEPSSDAAKSDGYLKKVPEFMYRYQGYLISNNVASGGTVEDTLVGAPRSIARRDKRAMYPIISLVDKVNKFVKEYKRNVEKLSDMEHHIRKEVDHKKLKIYRQQKHFTKKAIYEDEVRAYKVGRVNIREKVRKERAERLDPSDINSKKSLSTNWTNVNLKSATHLKEIFQQIVIEKQKGEKKKPKTVIPRLALSDFEEAYEKQRLIKYDLLWQRAEEVFMEKKKELAASKK